MQQKHFGMFLVSPWRDNYVTCGP